MTIQDKKQIEAYNLAEFCQLAQEKFLEGFTFDFTDNAHYPTSFGAFFSAVMIKHAEVVKQVQQATEAAVEAVESTVEAIGYVGDEVVAPAEAAASRGRPKKV